MGVRYYRYGQLEIKENELELLKKKNVMSWHFKMMSRCAARFYVARCGISELEGRYRGKILQDNEMKT